MMTHNEQRAADEIADKEEIMEGNAVTKIEPAGTVPAAITPMQMLQIAVERGADLDQMQKLMDLNDRWEATQAKKSFVTALNAFKENPPTIIKNKAANFGGRGAADDYATLDQVAAVIGAALSKHGLTHRWEVEHLPEAQIRVTCILTHEQGHSERVSMQAGPDTSGSKNSIQAVGSTVTYLERYTLLAATGLAAKGQDGDGVRDVDKISEGQKDRLIELQKEVSADTDAFLKYLNVESLDDLPANRFEQAVAALEKKRTKK